MRLAQVASLIRSKNAGPFLLTFDILFRDPEVYRRVKASRVLDAPLIARLYDCELASVRFFECDNALAFKATIPRRHTQGDFADPDLHGGQQHAPLMAVEIPPMIAMDSRVTPSRPDSPTEWGREPPM